MPLACAVIASTVVSTSAREVDRLARDLELAPVEAVREQNLLGDLCQPGRLRRDHVDELPSLAVRQDVLPPAQRLGGAVDSGHRRPQLVRDRRDEVGLLLLQPALARHVAERVHHTRDSAHRDERQPEIVAADLDRQRHRARAAVRLGDRDRRCQRRPAGQVVCERPAADVAGGQPGHRLGGAIPEPDDSVAVEQEDAVADGIEHLRGLLPLGCGSPRRSLRSLEAAPVFLEPRVANGRGHLGDQALDELELLLRVAAAVRHHLHDTHHPALVLHRQHHCGARAGRTRVGDLLDRPLPVDVVELAVLLDPLDDVVEEEGLAADDDPALHAAAGPVQRQRRQSRRVDDVALDPGVVAVDQVVALVVARDDEPVVLDHLAEQLVEALVDPLRLERLAELPGGVEEQLCDLGLARERALVHHRKVVEWTRKRRQAGRLPPFGTRLAAG